jgi:hypothetical protein
MTENPETMIVLDEAGTSWYRDDQTKQVVYRDGSTRPYTNDEVTAMNQRLVEQAARNAAESSRAKVKTALAGLGTNIAALQALIDTPDASINAAPAASIKALAGAIQKNLSLIKDVVTAE